MVQLHAETRGTALRERLTRNLILMVHRDMRPIDRRALKLARQEFGDRVRIVQRLGTDPEEDVLPRLSASANIYRGIDDIEQFIQELRGLNASAASGSGRLTKPKNSR